VAGVVAWLAVGLIGGCAVGVAKVANCCTGAVQAVLIALTAWLKRFLVFIQLAYALIQHRP